MNTLLFFIIASLLGVIYFILGIRASRRVTTDVDYFVAGRSLGIVQITCNLIATQIGGGLLLGTAAVAYLYGYYGILYTLGMCIGLLLLALGIASRLQQFKVTTTAQLFETQYKSVTLKKIASLLSIATFFGILIAQVVGFKSLLIGVGVINPLFMSAIWLSVVGYTMIGGLRAITINDIVQLALITIVFGAIFIAALMADSNILATFFTASTSSLFSSTDITTQKLFGTIALPALFSLFQQDLAQRFFASRSTTVATISALNAALFLAAFSLIPVYFGMKARMVGMIIEPLANPLIEMLKISTSDIVFALALCAIIAAIISTSDAIMNAISANITQDFNLARIMQIKNRLLVSKMVTLIVGTAALLCSFVVPGTIIDIIIGSYEISVSCLLVPLLVCYFKPAVRAKAAWGAILGGFIGFVLFRVHPICIPKEIMALGLSSLGYAVGQILK